MASLDDSQCRLAFLGERDERDFLEPLSTQTAVRDRGYFSVQRLADYQGFGCDYCILYPRDDSLSSIMSLVDSAEQCPKRPGLILLLLKQDTTHLEKALKEAGKSAQIILLKEQKVPPAAELINSYLIIEGCIKPPDTDWGFVGASEAVHKLYSEVNSLACWYKDPVLILGQTGTGKELIARYLSKFSPDRKFYAQNLAALPLDLAESLLFGHEKGSYTGASTSEKGLIVEAGEGVLFLDEIGETHPVIQAKLLRVLQEKKVSRLGREARPQPVRARFVFATNRELRELKEACRQGRFRGDFLQRIDALQIKVPPLSERREDIPRLVKHFVDEFKSDYLKRSEAGCAGGGPMVDRMAAADEKLFEKVREIRTDNLFKIELLFDYEWPGNVRELRSVVRAAIALTPSGAIDTLLAELLAEKQKDRERKQTEAETGETREHALQCDEQTHALGSFMKSLFEIDLETALSRFTELYTKDLFIETGGSNRLIDKYSGMSKTWRGDQKSWLKRSDFKECDLIEVNRLATRLIEGTDPVSTYVRDNFGHQVRYAANRRNGAHAPAELAEALVELLNDLRKDRRFYRPELFRQVELSDEARHLIKVHGRWTDLMTLNRILIEDAYPEAIVKDELIRAEVRKRFNID